MEYALRTATGTVKTNKSIAKNIYEMIIETDIRNTFIPGQFINIYLDDISMLLPRPISICEAKTDSVTIVYRAVGKGTEHLSSYSESQPIKISCPLGNGYKLEDDYYGKRVAILGGGIGIPPMLGLAKTLKERNAVLDIFLGFQTGVFLVEKFWKLSQNIHISTDDGSVGFHGNVLEMLESCGMVFDEYFACGPKAMLSDLCEYALKSGSITQVSVEERMGCGYGACAGCTCKVKDSGKIVRKSVCTHGPVFTGKELVLD